MQETQTARTLSDAGGWQELGLPEAHYKLVPTRKTDRCLLQQRGSAFEKLSAGPSWSIAAKTPESPPPTDKEICLETALALDTGLQIGPNCLL